MQEAIDWLKRCPNPHNAEGDVEIRPVYEMGVCSEAFSPELQAQAERNRATHEKR
jgi:hypothetical protein